MQVYTTNLKWFNVEGSHEIESNPWFHHLPPLPQSARQQPGSMCLSWSTRPPASGQFPSRFRPLVMGAQSRVISDFCSDGFQMFLTRVVYILLWLWLVMNHGYVSLCRFHSFRGWRPKGVADTLVPVPHHLAKQDQNKMVLKIYINLLLPFFTYVFLPYRSTIFGHSIVIKQT